MTLEEFLTLSLRERIAWLHGPDGPKGKLSHDKFAAALGTTRQTVIGWEGGTQPNTDYAKRLAEFSGFPVSAFRRSEAEAVSLAMIARRLEELATLVAELPTAEDLQRLGESMRRAIARASQGTAEGPRASPSKKASGK